MKIAMLDPSLFTGRYDDGLCAALARAGQEVSLIARPMRDTDAIRPQSYRYVPRFFRMGERMRGVLGDGRAFRAVKAAEYGLSCALGDLGRLRTDDIVHFQWLPFPAADARLIARLKGGPALVHTVHNAAAFHGDAGAQGRGYSALLRGFDALVVHGEETRAALLAQGLAPGRIHVVPHPPMRLAEGGEAVQRRAVPRVLFFGTIRPYKGLDVLVDACLSLWRQGADFDLAVAGKPFLDVAPMLDPVREAGFADRLVTELGFLAEERLDAHLRAADIVVFPYRGIDSSGAFLSALHYGKAVVATRVGMFAGLEESVTLCEPDDAGGLARALAPLIGDNAARASAGHKALALHAALPTWDDAARMTLAVYERAREDR